MKPKTLEFRVTLRRSIEGKARDVGMLSYVKKINWGRSPTIGQRKWFIIGPLWGRRGRLDPLIAFCFLLWNMHYVGNAIKLQVQSWTLLGRGFLAIRESFLVGLSLIRERTVVWRRNFDRRWGWLRGPDKREYPERFWNQRDLNAQPPQATTTGLVRGLREEERFGAWPMREPGEDGLEVAPVDVIKLHEWRLSVSSLE